FHALSEFTHGELRRRTSPARARRRRPALDGGPQLGAKVDSGAPDRRQHGLHRRDRAVRIDPARRALLHADANHHGRERLRVRALLERVLLERNDGQARVDAALDRVDQRLDEALPFAGQRDLAARRLDPAIAGRTLLLGPRIVADEPPAGRPRAAPRLDQAADLRRRTLLARPVRLAPPDIR